MHLVEYQTKIETGGRIKLPKEALLLMEMKEGERIGLFYLAESEEELGNETKEFLICTAEGKKKEKEETSFHIPVQLLKDAGISENANLDVICQKGRILILPSVKKKNTIKASSMDNNPPEDLESEE